MNDDVELNKCIFIDIMQVQGNSLKINKTRFRGYWILISIPRSIVQWFKNIVEYFAAGAFQIEAGIDCIYKTF